MTIIYPGSNIAIIGPNGSGKSTIIKAISPKLLILDEITNNLDLETKKHLIQVLEAYPGAMIIISHDEDFLRKINIQSYYAI
jgi:ATPase subunit of ABC transporter with duplicated ATPase domains